MAYVYSMYHYAAAALDRKNPLTRTASVSRQLQYAYTVGLSHNLEVIPIRGIIGAVSAYQAKRGDIVTWKRRGGSQRDIGKLWPGHTGLVLRKDGTKILTIEGNTGSSFADGDGVYKKWRPLSNVLAIIRVTT